MAALIRDVAQAMRNVVVGDDNDTASKLRDLKKLETICDDTAEQVVTLSCEYEKASQALAQLQRQHDAEAEAKDQIATVITGMDSDNLAEVFMTPEAAQNFINATVKMLNDAPTPIREALDLEALTLAI